MITNFSPKVKLTFISLTICIRSQYSFNLETFPSSVQSINLAFVWLGVDAVLPPINWKFAFYYTLGAFFITFSEGLIFLGILFSYRSTTASLSFENSILRDSFEYRFEKLDVLVSEGVDVVIAKCWLVGWVIKLGSWLLIILMKPSQSREGDVPSSTRSRDDDVISSWFNFSFKSYRSKIYHTDSSRVGSIGDPGAPDSFQVLCMFVH